MKKLINNPKTVVEEMMEGIAAAYPQYVKKLVGRNVLVRADAPVKGKVALLSGGGSGHEPAHGGYVGKGLLDGAVAGTVFTSPTPDVIYDGIKAVNGGSGVLLVVKNYTGDVMNFDMAKEMAEMDGIKVDSVIVNDDAAVEDSTFTTGRRGIAGTIFVHKIAGAAADRMMPLPEVKRIAEKVIANMRSMGVALSPCTVPEAGKPSFTLAGDEIEIGIGIHGEPGIRREKIKTADDVADELLLKILDDLPYSAGDDVAVMINGMGGTPQMELFIVSRHVASVLKNKGIKVYKTVVGEYMTSLEMQGASITLLKLDNELKELLDAPGDSIAFKSFGR